MTSCLHQFLWGAFPFREACRASALWSWRKIPRRLSWQRTGPWRAAIPRTCIQATTPGVQQIPITCYLILIPFPLAIYPASQISYHIHIRKRGSLGYICQLAYPAAEAHLIDLPACFLRSWLPYRKVVKLHCAVYHFGMVESGRGKVACRTTLVERHRIPRGALVP